jgi:hypothetical protein
MQKQHFPNYVRHHGFGESHGQLKLQVLSSKHNAHHRGQRLLDVKAELSDDKECEQIY